MTVTTEIEHEIERLAPFEQRRMAYLALSGITFSLKSQKQDEKLYWCYAYSTFYPERIFTDLRSALNQTLRDFWKLRTSQDFNEYLYACSVQGLQP